MILYARSKNSPWRRILYDESTDAWYEENIHDSNYIKLGYAPTPRNRFEWFVYNLCHGFIMRFNPIKVVLWSVYALMFPNKQSNPFAEYVE